MLVMENRLKVNLVAGRPFPQLLKKSGGEKKKTSTKTVAVGREEKYVSRQNGEHVRDSAWELVERRMQGPFSDLGNPDRQVWV
jgi:hypothetical protein